jgi:regulator of protease activity HflC (stomatin/prohibitin superfamily)
MLDRLKSRVAPYGLDVQDVLLYDVHPPNESEVAEAFLQQVNAIQSQKTDVENAQRDAIGTLSAAAGSRGEALRIADAIAELNRLRDQKESGAADGGLDEQITEQQARINRLIDRAGGEAASVLADARQERWQTALYEKSQSARFTFELAAFNLAPDYFKSRYYLDTLAEAFRDANRRVITTVPLNEESTIRLNLEDAGSTADLFTNQ